MSKGRLLIQVTSEFTADVKAQVLNSLTSIAKKLSEKVALSPKEKFLAVSTVFCYAAEKWTTKEAFAEQVNHLADKAYHVYPQACVAGETRLQLARYIEEAYNTSADIRKSPKVSDERFAEFREAQRHYSLNGSYPIISAWCTIQKNNAKRLRLWKFHPGFVEALKEVPSEVFTPIANSVIPVE